MPLWLKALTATLLMQAVASFLTRAVPVIGPALTGAAGVPAEAVGYLAAATAAGTLWALTGSAAVLPRFGALRLLQIGAGVGALGLLLTASGWWWAMLAAAFLLGAGYAPSPPAGSDILARHAPKRNMSLVFSVKQAGVPLGGVVAGLLIPATMFAFGWRGALAAAALVAVAASLLVQPWRSAIDAERESGLPLPWRAFTSLEILAAPFRSMRTTPGLPTITYAGFAFAIVQGSLVAFLVTYLATDLHLGLAAAGTAFAVMQAAGSIGRVAIGWLADRMGSNRRMLALLAASSAAVILLVAAIDSDWPRAAVIAASAAAGVAAVSWNGVYLAEVARLARAGAIAQATAGSTFFTFFGYMIGPALFAEIVGATGNYAAAFAATALPPLSACLLLCLRPRRARRSLAE